jgi:hypothetical protein
MNDTTLLDYLSKKIREDAMTYQNDIVGGRPKDFAEYKYLCGIQRGFYLANEIIQELKERMEKDDE